MSGIQKYFMIAGNLLMFILVNSITAQTLDEARTLYNEGVTAKNEENLELAVQKFHEFILITDELTEDDTYEIASEIGSVKNALPQMYLNLGLNKLKEKDIQSGLDYTLKSKNTAEQYGDNSTLEKSKVLLGKVYYSMALSKYKAEKFNEALIELDKSISESNDLKSHNLKLIILKEQEDDESFINAGKAAIKAAENVNDTEVKNNFIQTTSIYFLKKGNDAKAASRYDEAIKLLNISLEFNPESADAYYLLATVYNVKSNWDKAIEAAIEGLKYEVNGSQARFNYELGNAYLGKGDNAAACEAYSKAAVGEFAENATYQMEHVLKCE